MPLDVARRVRIGPGELKGLPGGLGEFLRRHAARWARRSLLIRGSRRFPVFDLAAAAYAIDPALTSVEETQARLHRNLWIEFGWGNRRLRVVRDLDLDGIWRLFSRLLSGRPAGDAALPAPAPSRPL